MSITICALDATSVWLSRILLHDCMSHILISRVGEEANMAREIQGATLYSAAVSGLILNVVK